MDEYFERFELEETIMAEFTELHQRLMNAAKRYEFQLRNVGCTHVGANDLVNETLARVLEGRRRLKRAASTTITDFLFGVMKSIASGFVDSNRNLVVDDADSKIEHLNIDSIPEWASTRSREMSPEEIVLCQNEAGKILKWLYDSFDDDEVVQDLLICAEDGLIEPNDIAQQSGRSVDEIYKAKKRLRRKIDDLKSLMTFPNSERDRK
ncbi:MAG: hypothetical protein P9L99_17375 [Candidatus Lernaella stagnicola]|nr:hypothetical protein [Candidatus Lernaella stagnicola]